jgi:CheY-like chemotaxis protein
VDIEPSRSAEHVRECNALLISQAGKNRAHGHRRIVEEGMNIPMNDFHVTEKAKAETGRTTDVRNIDLPYPQSADQPPTRVDPDENSGNRKFHTEGGSWKTGNRRTVLYVDDNPKALRMLKFVIEGSGYKVVAARDAGEALDLSLVNYRILKMMGSDPILAIKLFSPGTPIVLISGYALLPPQEFSHVDAHVGKGATLDILLDKIRALVVAHESSPAAASGSLEKRNETKLSA